MKRNISSKVWLKVFFSGIRQFIRNIFSWKNKTPFWRVIWMTNTVCIITIIAMFATALYKESFKRSMYRDYYYPTNYTQEYDADTVVVVEDVVELINE